MSHLPVQMFCKPARLILSTPVLVNQMTHSRVPCGNLSLSWRCIGPLNQTAKLGVDSLAKPGDHRVLSLSKTYRFAYQMGKTGLPLIHPLALDSVTIAYQNPCPVPDQLFESLFRPAGLDTEEGYRGVDHHPQPSQDSMLIPGGLVDKVHHKAARSLSDRHIVGKDRFRNAVNTTLNSSTTDRNTQHRLTEFFHSASAAALTCAQLANEPGKPRSVPNLEPLRHYPFAAPATSGAFPFLQHKMRNLHLDFRELDMLMRVKRSQVLKFLTPTLTRFRRYRYHFRRRQKRLLMPFVALLGSAIPAAIVERDLTGLEHPIFSKRQGKMEWGTVTQKFSSPLIFFWTKARRSVC